MPDDPVGKVLVADDNAQNLELIEAYLSELDCEVLTAVDGQETLDVVEQTRPDVILLDMSIEDAAKLVISAGLVYPNEKDPSQPPE